MKQRKIITWIIVLTVCLALFSAAAFADETETGWSLDENGVLTISSDTGMTNWVSNRSSYASQVASVVIESGVTAIAAHAFDSCTSLTEITIPDSVTSIGDYAFLNCTSLLTVEVSCVAYNTIKIAGNAFEDAAASDVTITHAWDEGAVQTAATCTTDGEMLYTCTVEGCGAMKTEAIPATGHNYDTDNPHWSWAEDYSSATVSFTCADCNDVHTENATVTSEVTTAATETEAGVTAYIAVAVFNVNGMTYVDIRAVEDIPATGHSYGDPAFTWAEDYSAATASFTCAACGDVQTAAATVTSEVKTAATAAENGVTVYTATVTFNGVTYTATKELADIPATGEATEPPAESASPSATPTATATATANTAPTTGDGASPLLWALLAAVCAAGFGAVLALGRKEKAER